MHILGLLGMPRRVYTYREGWGWGTLNVVVTVGAFLFGVGVLLSLVNVVWSRRRGDRAGANPWGADTLEWSTSSPPEEYNFRRLPIVAGRHPLWDPPPAEVAESGDDVRLVAADEDGAAAKTMLATTGMAAEPQDSDLIPEPSRGPVRRRVRLDGLLRRPALPRRTRRMDRCRHRRDRRRLVDLAHRGRTAMSNRALLVRSSPLSRSSGFDPGRSRPTAFWGMAMAIATESMLFAGLLSSYFFLRASADQWPLGDIPEPELRLVVPFTVILLSSSVPVWYAERSIGRGNLRGLRLGLAAAFVLGAMFIAYTASRVRDRRIRRRRQRVCVGLPHHDRPPRPARIGGIGRQRGCAGQGVDRADRRATQRNRADLGDVLAFRRRGVGRRVHVAVPLAEVVMNRSTSSSAKGDRTVSTDSPKPSERPEVAMWSSGPTHGFWLWYASLAGIVLWLAHLIALAALVEFSCSHPAAEWVMHGLTVALAAATGVAGWMSLALVRGRPDRRSDAGDLDGRLRFMGLFGLLTEITSFVLIVWEGAYVPFVDACS